MVNCLGRVTVKGEIKSSHHDSLLGSGGLRAGVSHAIGPYPIGDAFQLLVFGKPRLIVLARTFVAINEDKLMDGGDVTKGPQ